jgi:hypothetical protein
MQATDEVHTRIRSVQSSAEKTRDNTSRMWVSAQARMQECDAWWRNILPREPRPDHGGWRRRCAQQA